MIDHFFIWVPFKSKGYYIIEPILLQESVNLTTDYGWTSTQVGCDGSPCDEMSRVATQGEELSPLRPSLHVSHVEEVFLTNGATGTPSYSLLCPRANRGFCRAPGADQTHKAYAGNPRQRPLIPWNSFRIPLQWVVTSVAYSCGDLRFLNVYKRLTDITCIHPLKTFHFISGGSLFIAAGL